MEPHKNETTPESTGEDQVKQQRPPERKRRFQIVKREERIAPDRLISYAGTCHCGFNGSHGAGGGCLN